MTVRFDDADKVLESECGNLIAEMAGTAPGRTIVMSAHMDTVEPGCGIEPVVTDGVVSSRGDTVLGADDKAGLAAIIECVRRIHESATPHAAIRVLLTVAEEKGLRGAKALVESDMSGDLCLVLDAAGAPGGIVTAAPTHYTFFASFRGHAAHAGVEPEKGASAVAMAANAVTSMRLGRLDPETTANIGQIMGGGATNVVSATCTLTGECRSLDPAKAESVRAEMDAAMRAAARSHGGNVDVEWTKEYDGFRFADDDERLAIVQDACRDVGIEPRRFHTGGGSDGSVFSAKGLASLVLSSGMMDVHGTAETLKVSDLVALERLLLAVIERARE